MATQDTSDLLGPLSGLRVLEVGDEKVEFCGRLLTGGDADIVKVEPPGGSPTREYGPFYQDERNPDRSLYFWHYNLGKRSVTLNLDSDEGRQLFKRLAERADVVLDGMGLDYLNERGLGYEELSSSNPRLVMCAITDFGRTGPWRDYQASDMMHLALGGQMMVTGYLPVGDYDPTNPAPHYDTPPIAPQMWQAYHTAGVNAAVAIYGALFHREMSGTGQFIDTSIHTAMAACTELPVPHWIYNQAPVWRQTGSHAMPSVGLTWQQQAGDGKPIFTMSAIGGFGGTWDRFVEMLDTVGIADDLGDEKYQDPAYRRQPEVATRVRELTDTFITMLPAEEAMRLAQKAGLAWSEIRWPEDNLDDEHWQARGVFQDIEHDELGGKKFTYVVMPFLCEQMPWKVGSRAAMVGEHTDEVLGTDLGLSAGELSALRSAGVV